MNAFRWIIRFHWPTIAMVLWLLVVPPVNRPFAHAGVPTIGPLALSYVASIEIVERTIYGHTHKTLLVHLLSPMAVTSTLEGFREQVRYVGNSYTPPQCWDIYHQIGLEASRNRLLAAIGRDARDTSLLFTGVDMDHLSVQRKQHRQMIVYALVTAGARSNALRMGIDEGAFYEPGTINILIMPNMHLSPSAMLQSVLSATEAKTAALWDMDIRSSQTPLVNPATGTGTDNIIVVEGAGGHIENAGGHTKMGELIGRAVYAGVQEALRKQNGISPRRSVLQRLEERHVPLESLLEAGLGDLSPAELTKALRSLLTEKRYAGFLEAALALSDSHHRGLLVEMDAFRSWCEHIRQEITGKPAPPSRPVPFTTTLPPILRMALEVLVNGAAARYEE